MNNVRVEKLRDDVVGIKPIYTERGNASELLLADGRVLLDFRSLEAVLNGLLLSYGLEPKAQRKYIRESLGRKSILPFFLPRGRVFIPIKMRSPVAAGDNVYGYVDRRYIVGIEDLGKKASMITLSNGLSLEVLSKRDTVLKSEDVGKRLKAILDKEEKPLDADSRKMQELMLLGSWLIKRIIQQLDRIERVLDRRDN